MNLGILNTTIENKIATVAFFHPSSNSLPGDLLKRMAAEFDELSTNDEVQVIILKSEGNRAFCAGASFDELLSINNKEEGTQFFLGFANLINSMRTCHKVIIGMAQGKSVGGGVGLIAACDYAIATKRASIKLSELFIGIGAFVIEPVLTRKIGKSAFSQLTLEATEWRTAYWAKEKGLFAKVTEDMNEMEMEALNLAEKLASYHPDALFEMKKIFWEGTEHWNELLPKRAGISGELVLSDFTTKTLERYKTSAS